MSFSFLFYFFVGFFSPFVLFKKKVHKLKTELFFFAGSVPLFCSLRLQTGVKRWWQWEEGGNLSRSKWKCGCWEGVWREDRAVLQSQRTGLAEGRSFCCCSLGCWVPGRGRREMNRSMRYEGEGRGVCGRGDPHFRCFSSLSPLLVLLSVWLLGLLLRYILSMALSASVR